jgi:hypothetical protein
MMIELEMWSPLDRTWQGVLLAPTSIVMVMPEPSADFKKAGAKTRISAGSYSLAVKETIPQIKKKLGIK